MNRLLRKSTFREDTVSLVTTARNPKKILYEKWSHSPSFSAEEQSGPWFLRLDPSGSTKFTNVMVSFE